MGQQIPITTSFNLPDGREVVIETGKLAAQADGSVVVRVGKTMLFATVVSSKDIREGQDFFPLSVDYQEKFASAGRIPGNFFRRETRLSDYEVLISRLVDRAIRPLFPDGYLNETQIIINLISLEKGVLPDAFTALAASAALSVSNIPFLGPISEVRVARINGEFRINPDKADLAGADMDFIVAATDENVVMVEGEANECSEIDLVEAIKVAHEAIKVQIDAQRKLAALVGEKAANKRPAPVIVTDEELAAHIAERTKDKIYAISRSGADKQTRKAGYDQIKTELKQALLEEKGEEYLKEKSGLVSEIFDTLKKKVVREMVLTDRIRLDGRGLEDIRPIWCEVDYLPSAHGSAVFTRGETQSLTSLTLGTKLDEAMLDNAQELTYEKFILHYNFPGYSVGEVKPQRGPGRREVGHANLAARSLRKVLPTGLPYTLRLVSDILESNGSSSMATVCAGALALMDGGVQIKAPVSGIAMGLITDGDRFAVLSDILGDEDALGDMDFKVTGTENGITACQMDIKIDGLPYEVMVQALDQAKKGRVHILNEMAKTLPAPREDYKPHAPRIVEILIDKSYIGAVIGPGGKVIQEIQAETGTIINISEVGDKGVVNIASSDKAAIDAALDRIRRITFTPEVGDVYRAVVKSVMPYGVFVEFNGKSGLLHVSEISHSRVENVEDYLKEGDEVKVKLVEIDKKTGKLRLSRKALLPPPQKGNPNSGQEGDAQEQKPRERHDGDPNRHKRN
ncbi:MAG: polyribonucleotide nucleotidyltransferase [Haliscomenobacter sp.]|nr:polyribonucleotide nucleotidyltransferase [Haliscomenobacter sp.]MBP9075740.1 polyribonucleotide nucleotidyltransferase [Haliscomenobacter sp.]MBP9874141.1 polyribonucleotide nucleotidyltransferase [Haliscomenobacter sp.]